MTTNVRSSAVAATIVDAVIPLPTPVSVFSTGFESGVSGFNGDEGTVVVQSSDYARSGTKSLKFSGGMTNRVSFEPVTFENGIRYRVTLWVLSNATSPFGISNRPVSPAPGPPVAAAAVWEQRSFEWRHRGPSSPLYLLNDGLQPFYIDDLEIIQLNQRGDLPLVVKTATIRLDERTAPYAEARLVCALPELESLESLNPYDDLRATVVASQAWLQPSHAPQSREFDLHFHERTINHEAGEVEVVLHTDEALLIDAGNDTAAAVDRAVANQTSLRDIIDDYLGDYSAALEAGVADADLTITTERINLLINPSGEVNATGWSDWTGTSAVARSTTVGGWIGSAAIRATASAAESSFRPVTSATDVRAVEGEVFTFSVYVRSSVARSCRARLSWRASDGSAVSGVDGASATTSTGAWTRYTVTGTCPPGAVYVLPYITTTGNSAGNFHYADGALLERSATVGDYFDGDTATDTYYSYAWDDTAHASTSRRIRLDDRDPRLLFQKPGEKDWDFLSRLVQLAGLRLFSDETRAWYLVDGTYTVPGDITLTADENVTLGTDVMSLRRDDYADAVVITYRWIGEDGTQQERSAAAIADVGGGKKLLHITRDSPYPGTGEAQTFLDRALERGRIQTVTALQDYDATPGNTLNVELPGTAPQTGVLASVQWQWNETDVDMTVTARTLEDA